MKKIFTLFVAFLALTFCAKAQVTIILEAHNVWGDGTGYQLLLDADHNTYGTIIPESGGLTSSGDAPASVYAEFEYKVPVNADGSLTTSNMVLDGSVTISIPAGTYDFCITNPTPDDRMWIASNGIDPTRADDYVFVDGNTYHFLMIMNTDGHDACQLTITSNPTTPTISPSPATVNFGSVMLGNSANNTVTVNTYLLTSDVTATTAAPFEISADGTTYGTTATVPATGGTLNVRYTPTAAGTDNGTITLSSTGANNVTVNLTGTAMDCGNTPIPYSYSFTDENANQCWEIINANNDAYTFEFNTSSGFASIRWNTSMAADDWLISPSFTLTGNEICFFDYKCGMSSYPEKFQVFALGTDTVALTPAVDVSNTDYLTQYLDLSSLTGNYRIAIHCISDPDKYRFYVANFNMISSSANISVNTEAIDFGTVGVGSPSAVETVVITALNVTNPVSVSVAAPFEISADGTTFGASLNFPASTDMVVYDTFYVRFAPTAPGTFNQNVTVTAGTLSKTIALTGEGIDCSQGITTFPFLYDFNTGTYPPMCWGYNDADNYGMATVDDNGDKAMYFQGLDMLVTPEITSTSPMALMFGYRSYLGNYGETPTSFRVGYSTTDNNVSSFTWLNTVSITDYPEGDELFFIYNADLPANAKYVAIDVMELGTYSYYDDVIFIDNFRLFTDGDFFVSPESLSFGSMLMGGDPIVKTANVTASLLTNNIAVSAPANFEVSANGTSYAASATLPQTGGTLYVRYNPSAAGNHTGNVTLTSGSLSKTIAVFGSAVDCSSTNTLPFTENFESELNECWQNIDNDGDGYYWESSLDLGIEGYESDACFMSASYDNSYGVLTPDNWLITPALAIPSEGAKLTWYVAAQDPNWPEEFYEVKLSTSPSINSFTSVFSETLESGEWEQRTVNIDGNWAGQTIYIAFQHHNSSDMYMMKIDNLSVTALTGVESHELNTTIFPNPANNVLNINSNSNINRVEVYNMMGQMIGMYNVNDLNTQINTNSFANGVYMVKIETENGTTTKKFTVAR